ncbi:hypothetical protein DBR47_11315 [Paucibacter sp. KBW04]|uniref:PspC domain-containing protein n=1 Tax=Paucibacter sp. KBW04 TaxID=2153361 RepID=UPI000F57057C|nr:PspC domain-containing protein [Paucibacter sp. KBW04]RQO59943.1 hypothetical protein DBR47_11315 [Paucibacter sp. KBW04]
MSFSTDLEQLADLHQRGLLSDEEFARAKARLLGDMPHGQANATGRAFGSSNSNQTSGGGLGAAVNRLQRSRDDRWLGGVCGGLAQISGLASWIWRLMFLGLLFCNGVGFVVYLLLWLLVPENKDLPRLSWNGASEEPKSTP